MRSASLGKAGDFAIVMRALNDAQRLTGKPSWSSDGPRPPNGSLRRPGDYHTDRFVRLGDAIEAVHALDYAEARLGGCVSVDVDLAQLDRLDGAGAVVLARLIDRLDAEGRHARIIEGPSLVFAFFTLVSVSFMDTPTLRSQYPPKYPHEP